MEGKQASGTSFYSAPPEINIKKCDGFDDFLHITGLLLKQYCDEELSSDIFQRQVGTLLDRLYEIAGKSYLKMLDIISQVIWDTGRHFGFDDSFTAALAYYNTAVRNYRHEAVNIFPIIPLKVALSGKGI